VHGLDGAVRDMALLFGSCEAPHNRSLQSLEASAAGATRNGSRVPGVWLSLWVQGLTGSGGWQELMAMLCSDSCDDVIKLTGLKVVRACVYIDPDKKYPSEKDREKSQVDEYLRYLHNMPPKCLEGNDADALKSYKDIQTRVAQLGSLSLSLPPSQSLSLSLSLSLSQSLSLSVSLSFSLSLARSHSLSLSLSGGSRSSQRACRRRSRRLCRRL